METNNEHSDTEKESPFFSWLEEFRTRRPDSWEHVPDIGLYMDQVVGYLNDQLAPFGRDRDAAVLTPSMVNNYVKFSYVSRPTRKRYSREQIAVLYLLCSMKQTLPIPDAAALIEQLTASEKNGSIEAVYRSFIAEQAEEAQRVAAEVLKAKEGGREELMQTALKLTLRAEAMRLTAERMISDAIEQDKTETQLKREALRRAQEEERRAAKLAKAAAAHAEHEESEKKEEDTPS